MPDESAHQDAEIVLAAYAERVRESFKIFADNMGVGENEKLCRDRFARSLQILRRARDMALQISAGHADGGVAEPPAAAAAAAKPAEATEAATDQLSAEYQALVDKALAGTRGATLTTRYPRR